MANDDASWQESRRLIEGVLTRLENSVNNLAEEIKQLREENHDRLDEAKADFNAKLGVMQVNIAMLQVKAGVWGLIGGAIPVVIAILVEMLRK